MPVRTTGNSPVNNFPRNSRFDGHLIRALPNSYRCAECDGQLVYICGTDTESAHCFLKPIHTGLKRVEDVYVPVADRYSELKELIRIDPTVASAVKRLNQHNATIIFGGSEL